MTTPRSSQFPATNLKERIAALEQRNAESTASVQRATSPTPSITSNSSHSGPSNGALRDRIARFEKKGGVPVPRGRFGLGAPSSVEGPRKRGELYGNRIPVPSRIVSGGYPPLSRPGSTSPYDQRRSFSASSVMTDFDDDHLDFSPLSSPILTALSSDSPDSISSIPDISPSTPDFPNSKQPKARATSFAQALEVARKADTEKQERQDSINLSSRTPPQSESDGHLETPPDATPTIVVSSDDVPPAVMPDIPIVNAESVPLTTPSLEKVHEDKPLSETITASSAAAPVMTTTHNPVVTKEAVRIGTPPLKIRKRALANSDIPSVDNASKGTDTNEAQVAQVLVSPIPQAVELHDVPAWISDAHKEEAVNSLPISQPNLAEVDEPVPSEDVELVLSAPESLPTLPPPDIVILDEQPEEKIRERDGTEDDPFINSMAGTPFRKPELTLDTGKLDNETLISPPQQSDSLSTSLADAFLSPPDTGLHLGTPLSTSDSLMSSLGSRPMSMIETSPRVVTQILRMTPATSKGVPMFLPGHAPARRTDFVYFPPTPENEETDLGPSHPNRMRRGSDPEDIRNMPSAQTFSAVVHRKVREPVSASVLENKPRPLPQTPQARRVQRATILETPLSPGHGELAALLQEAVLLEDTLNKGELPSEETQLKEEEEARAKEVAEAEAKAKAEEEERSRLALATAQLQNKRDEPTAGLLKHNYLVSLTKARSRQRKEVYTAKAEAFLSKTAEPSIHPQSAGLPSRSATTNSIVMASDSSQKIPAKQPTVNDAVSQLPAKSSKFSSLRKFSSVSRAGGGALARTSHSTSSEVSSEESSSVVTLDEFGRNTGSTLSFPSVSPKRASSTLARATSFAEKLFSRGRTRSGGSTLSSASEVNVAVNNSFAPKIPAIAPAISLDFPTLPDHQDAPPLLFDEPDPIVPIRRSASSKRSAMYFPPGSDPTPIPQLPSIISGFELASQQPSSTTLHPISTEGIRPSSANSLSSLGSLPSPLFNQELVDAFPSVPVTTPTTINFPHREINLAATPSFDTALLSSAIHLASTYKTGTPKSTPKASSKPLPSERAATPTLTPRKSGEMRRER